MLLVCELIGLKSYPKMNIRGIKLRLTRDTEVSKSVSPSRIGPTTRHESKYGIVKSRA